MPRGPCTLLPLHGHQWARRSSVLTSPSRSLARHGQELGSPSPHQWPSAGFHALELKPLNEPIRGAPPAPRKHCGQLSGRSSPTLLGSIPPCRLGRESLAGSEAGGFLPQRGRRGVGRQGTRLLWVRVPNKLAPG